MPQLQRGPCVVALVSHADTVGGTGDRLQHHNDLHGICVFNGGAEVGCSLRLPCSTGGEPSISKPARANQCRQHRVNAYQTVDSGNRTVPCSVCTLLNVPKPYSPRLIWGGNWEW